MSKLWFASSMRPYPEDDPPYYNLGDFPWTVAYERQWQAVKEELTKLVEEKDREFQSSSLLYEKLGPTGKWHNLQFFYWKKRMKFYHDLKKCPTLHSLIKQTPGIVSAGLSRLEGHSIIPEHRGDTNGTVRAHFGIEIPAGIPDCGFTVNNEDRSWEEGKWMIFNDACQHKAWNNTGKRRIVLLIDVVRPQFMHKKNLICTFILARHVSFFYHRSKFIAKMPVWIKTIMFGIALCFIYVAKPVHNLFR